jgi:uncharacterized protein YjiS (DUF1127 family)
MSTHFLTTPAALGTPHQGLGLRAVAQAVTRVHAVHVSRRELAELDSRLLRDIGVTEPQARAEVNRPVWDVVPVVPGRRGPKGDSPLRANMDGVLAKIRVAWRRQRTRHSITELDACALRDIGVTFAEAEREANKPFWRS